MPIREDVRHCIMSAYAACAKPLEVVLFALLALCRTVADNALADPLGLEAVVQLLQILNDVAATANDGLLGCDAAVGLHAELEGCEERMGNLVGGEDDVVVLEEALRKEIAKGMILLVEREDGGVGDPCCMRWSVISSWRGTQCATYESPPWSRPSADPRLAGRARI
jgi:hypothetical protein